VVVSTKKAPHLAVEGFYNNISQLNVNTRSLPSWGNIRRYGQPKDVCMQCLTMS